MEVLFELFSNPIALFILIGVISSLFNKAKGKAQEQQRRQVRPTIPPAAASEPEEIQRDQRRDTRRESERTSKPVQPRPPITDRASGSLSEIQKVYQEKKRQAERPVSSQREADRVSRLSSGDSTGRLRQERKNPEIELNFQPDRDRLVEGLVWAEVLGQPRAKKPYNPSRRN